MSAKALLDRIVAILAKPRPMVQLGDYYGPEPRKLIDEPCEVLDCRLLGAERIPDADRSCPTRIRRRIAVLEPAGSRRV